MRHFVQYHNGEKLGWVPFDEEPFLQTRLSIATRKPLALQTVGSIVFVIASLGRPRRYYLWEHFRVEGVEPEGADFCVWGTGRQLVPPVLLDGDAFEAFRQSCAYFIGFRQIDDLAFTATLRELSERPAGPLDDEAEAFCSMLVDALPNNADVHYHRGFVRQRLGRHREAVVDLEEAIRRGTEFRLQAEECLRRARAGLK